MNERSLVSALLIALVAPTLTGADLAPEVLLLSRIKEAARQGLSQIPAYACSETVGRFTRVASAEV